MATITGGLDIREVLDINANAQALAKELQSSLPVGLRCAVFIFTGDAGPCAFAHTAGKGPKFRSILEDALKKVKEKESDHGLVTM